MTTHCSTDEPVYITDPEICRECTEIRENQKIDQMFNYAEAEVTVTTKRRPVEGRTRRSKGGAAPGPSASFTSTWLTDRQNALVAAAKTDKIVVSSDDTILVVKLKILEKLEIEPNEQVNNIFPSLPPHGTAANL